ncbi:MAG TPA: biotin--[acetyl-CoA-carboxylase] ligase [Chitinophagaceae bacterium]|nr:biotin--[acetyl-CoA-carboxylase] ligase [Chitinophagaceae bacterium]
MISTGGHLTILESVDSTNNYAMAMVRTGMAKHGDAFFAMAQTAGKGQRGKTWVTEPGSNIILTTVLQPQRQPLQRQFAFSTAMALAASDFFNDYTHGDSSIKWPNDIYWRDRKAGGILIENIFGNNAEAAEPGAMHEKSELTSGHWLWAITGMGININQTRFADDIRHPVSLQQITGKTWDVLELTKALCQHIEQRFRQFMDGTDVLAEYNQRLYKLGETVTFKKETRVFKGTVKGVNAAGQLLLTTAMEEAYNFGEIEWVL